MFQKRDIPRPQPPAGPAPTTHNPLHIVEEGDIVKENTPPSTLKQTEIRPTVTRTTSVNSRISSTSKILLRLKMIFHAIMSDAFTVMHSCCCKYRTKTCV